MGLGNLTSWKIPSHPKPSQAQVSFLASYLGFSVPVWLSSFKQPARTRWDSPSIRAGESDHDRCAVKGNCESWKNLTRKQGFSSWDSMECSSLATRLWVKHWVSLVFFLVWRVEARKFQDQVWSLTFHILPPLDVFEVQAFPARKGAEGEVSSCDHRFCPSDIHWLLCIQHLGISRTIDCRDSVVPPAQVRPVYSGWHDVSFLGGSVLAYACESVSLAPARTFLSVSSCRSTSIKCSLLQYAAVTD